MTDRRFTPPLHTWQRASLKNPRSPALERLKLRLDHDNLELTGYDLEFGIQRSIEVESDCSGEFVILPRLLSEAVRRFSGDVVTMEVDDNYVVKLFCDATEFQISAMSSEEYPALPSPGSGGRYADRTAGAELHDPADQLRHFCQRGKTGADRVSCSRWRATPCTWQPLTAIAWQCARNPFPVRKTTALWYRNGPCWRWQICSTTMPKNSAPFPQTAGTWYSNSTGYTVFSRLLEGEFHNYREQHPVLF